MIESGNSRKPSIREGQAAIVSRLRRFKILTIVSFAALLCISAPQSILLPGSASISRADTTDDQPVRPEVREAVDKALNWLSKHQKAEGNWQTGNGFSTSVPALAVMAFLARGHQPGEGPYGDVINNAIDFVLKQQKEDGLIAGNAGNAHMYEHGIATVMLSEVYGSVDDTRKAKIGKALSKSVALILAAQKPARGPEGKPQPKAMPNTGGWRYQKSSPDADISVTGWQLMALRGAANCGATVPKEALDAGREFIRRCAVPAENGGGFSYQAKQRDPNPPRSGTGILSMELLGDRPKEGEHSDEALRAGDYLLSHPLTDPNQSFYYYGVYYISQAYNQLGGKYMSDGYPVLTNALLASQGQEGSWPNGNGQEMEVGEAYRTSMAVLALCVPYRYLPLYQK